MKRRRLKTGEKVQLATEAAAAAVAAYEAGDFAECNRLLRDAGHSTSPRYVMRAVVDATGGTLNEPDHGS